MFGVLIRPLGAIPTNIPTKAMGTAGVSRRRLRLRWLIGADGRLRGALASLRVAS